MAGRVSAFSLLENADEHGHVDGIDAARGFTTAAAGKARKQQAASSAGQNKAGAPAQTRAEDYYRAFEHVYLDPTNKEVVLRFHKTNIVRIRPNGDMMLTTGGWFTGTTVSALNDALYALDMQLTYQPPVAAGKWIVTDDQGKQWQFKDRMVLEHTTAAHANRGAKLLRAYNGGVDVPRYARKPAPGAAAPTAAASQPAGAGTAAARSTGAAGTRPGSGPQHVNYQQAALSSVSGPRAASAADIHQQLAAAMQEVGLGHDELAAGDDHLCVVCLENPRDEVLVPCGHMVLCHFCCEGILASTNECPMCRVQIEDHCVIDPADF